MAVIRFFEEDVQFDFQEKKKVKNWLSDIALQEKQSLYELNYIFCSDAYLLQINKEYLNHDYYTDIITFDNSFSGHGITADVFISIERVKENAQSLGTSFFNELHRVMAHGLLHLLGYGDKTPNEKAIMRQKEDTCLSLLN